MLQKIKELFKYRITFLIVGVVICGILFFIFSEEQRPTSKSSVFKQINYYYYSWQDYRHMSGTELHDQWNKKFHDARYKWDGNSKYNEYDCTSAVYWLFQDLKSNYALSNVEDLFKRLSFVSAKRNSAYEVEVGDLIIIYIGGSNWHVGIVEGKEGSIIKYMDMDVASIGAGYRQVAFGYNTIRGIYPVTFYLWIGDLFKNIEVSKDMHIVIKSEKIEEVKEKDIKKVDTKKFEPKRIELRKDSTSEKEESKSISVTEIK